MTWKRFWPGVGSLTGRQGGRVDPQFRSFRHKVSGITALSNGGSAFVAAKSAAYVLDASASQTLTSTSLITPEAGIEFLRRGVDPTFAVAPDEGRFHAFAGDDPDGGWDGAAVGTRDAEARGGETAPGHQRTSGARSRTRAGQARWWMPARSKATLQTMHASASDPSTAAICSKETPGWPTGNRSGHRAR